MGGNIPTRLTVEGKTQAGRAHRLRKSRLRTLFPTVNLGSARIKGGIPRLTSDSRKLLAKRRRWRTGRRKRNKNRGCSDRFGSDNLRGRARKFPVPPSETGRVRGYRWVIRVEPSAVSTRSAYRYSSDFPPGAPNPVRPGRPGLTG